LKDRKSLKKHIPMRMCIVTHEKKSKSELIRFVKIDNTVKVDLKGKERGRGANISMDIDIFEKSVKKHLIEKALKLGRNLTEKEINKLRSDFTEAIDEKKFRKGNKPVTIKIDKDTFKKVLDNKIKQ
jgi:predicted RNA-binding protein YlxR (DUF448 family)